MKHAPGHTTDKAVPKEFERKHFLPPHVLLESQLDLHNKIVKQDSEFEWIIRACGSATESHFDDK